MENRGEYRCSGCEKIILPLERGYVNILMSRNNPDIICFHIDNKMYSEESIKNNTPEAIFSSALLKGSCERKYSSIHIKENDYKVNPSMLKRLDKFNEEKTTSSS